MKEKVVIGMSGGVDSSVCAYLLKEAGYDCIGVTMRLWDDDETVCTRAGHVGCCGSGAVEDAMRVCSVLSIPFHVLQLKEQFQRDVVDYFCDAYRSGRTPNPCIACNRYLKWGAMLEKARSLGAEYIATGHYARIERLANGRWAVRNSVTVQKDQTYVLYPLSQKALAHTLMPIGDYEKDEVRAIAGRIGLPTAAKRDSQDICFVPDGDYGAFLERQVGAKRLPPPGDFVTADGTVVGRHRGITHYTIGQRKGLGLSLGEPVFVNRIDAAANRVTVGTDEECHTSRLVAGDVHVMAVPRFDEGEEYIGRIRYSDPGTPCRVRYVTASESRSVDRHSDGRTDKAPGNDETFVDGAMIEVTFTKPVRAVTPGQAVVLYKGGYVAGGGTILS